MNGRIDDRSRRQSGRPTSFVRNEAIDAAMNLFWRKGFPAVSASELADAMSLQRSSFYNSFGSREDVFRAALERYATQSPDAPLDVVAPGQAVVPVLVSVFREICRVRAADHEARGCLICNSIGELVGVDPVLGPLVERAVAHRVSSFSRLIRQAVRQKEMTAPADVVATADACVAFLIGLNAVSKCVRSEKRLWAAARRFLIGIGVTNL